MWSEEMGFGFAGPAFKIPPFGSADWKNPERKYGAGTDGNMVFSIDVLEDGDYSESRS
jgi:hypothetical protein